MPEYRRRNGKDTWHWCRNCSNWPTGRKGVDYVSRKTKPTAGKLDNECRAKDRDGNCRK
jgi:hypothetical protein